MLFRSGAQAPRLPRGHPRGSRGSAAGFRPGRAGPKRKQAQEADTVRAVARASPASIPAEKQLRLRGEGGFQTSESARWRASVSPASPAHLCCAGSRCLCGLAAGQAGRDAAGPLFPSCQWLDRAGGLESAEAGAPCTQSLQTSARRAGLPRGRRTAACACLRADYKGSSGCSASRCLLTRRAHKACSAFRYQWTCLIAPTFGAGGPWLPGKELKPSGTQLCAALGCQVPWLNYSPCQAAPPPSPSKAAPAPHQADSLPTERSGKP